MAQPLDRRRFISLMGTAGAGVLLAACTRTQGSSTAGAGVDVEAGEIVTADIGPLDGIEQPDLTLGFIPITCASPLIMADPLGFYEKHGLNVEVRPYGGWADIRDAYIAGEIDGSHLLSPMPLSISEGYGSAQVATRLAAMGNINGQAITLANEYQGQVSGPADLAGMTLTVPFEYSMHNFLLRAYLAEGGLDPDEDVNIEVMRPPDMVASLVTGNIDGYLGPDPFGQRAVYEGAGYLFQLTRDMWDGHPCCGFGVQEEFIEANPTTYRALIRAITDASLWSAQAENREMAAQAIAPEEYLNQPAEVVEAVLTGEFDDGTGERRSVPDRIDFDPYPWASFGMWMLTQMNRWGLDGGSLDDDDQVQEIARRVFDTDAVAEAMEALDVEPPDSDVRVDEILGKDFDPDDALAWSS